MKIVRTYQGDTFEIEENDFSIENAIGNEADFVRIQGELIAVKSIEAILTSEKYEKRKGEYVSGTIQDTQKLLSPLKEKKRLEECKHTKKCINQIICQSKIRYTLIDKGFFRITNTHLHEHKSFQKMSKRIIKNWKKQAYEDQKKR